MNAGGVGGGPRVSFDAFISTMAKGAEATGKAIGSTIAKCARAVTNFFNFRSDKHSVFSVSLKKQAKAAEGDPVNPEDAAKVKKGVVMEGSPRTYNAYEIQNELNMALRGTPVMTEDNPDTYEGKKYLIQSELDMVIALIRKGTSEEGISKDDLKSDLDRLEQDCKQLKEAKGAPKNDEQGIQALLDQIALQRKAIEIT